MAIELESVPARTEPGVCGLVPEMGVAGRAP